MREENCDFDHTQAGPIHSGMIINCNCQEGVGPSCQLKEGGSLVEGESRLTTLCKDNAGSLCRSAVSKIKELFHSAPNIDECKHVDRNYKIWQVLWESCDSEYSFNVLSYRVEIV